MEEHELREILAHQSEHDILVEVAVSVGRLEERTASLPAMEGRLAKVESDVRWFKRIGTVIGTLVIGAVSIGTTIVLKIKDLV